METPKYKTALIVGAGAGLSASLARLFSREGIRVALAARQIEKLGALCSETGARAFACDATSADEVERLFGLVEREIGVLDLDIDLLVNNAGMLVEHERFGAIAPKSLTESFAVNAAGAFLLPHFSANPEVVAEAQRVFPWVIVAPIVSVWCGR